MLALTGRQSDERGGLQNTLRVILADAHPHLSNVKPEIIHIVWRFVEVQPWINQYGLAIDKMPCCCL